MDDIEKTLAERNKRYGDFVSQSHIARLLKYDMHGTDGWGRLSHDKKEALDMIVQKISRILNGDPEYRDSWHDISGYAKLVADTLEQE